MKFRTLPETDIRVSEIGFGLWTISTGWWGQFTEGEAIALMHRALDLGITLFDAADTYGNGLSEELIAKAFPKQRDQIVIATKVGYNFYEHGNERRGQREIPQDFSVPFIREAVEKALQRLNTDRIDILQLHNIRMPQVEDDALWQLMKNSWRREKSAPTARRSDRPSAGSTRASIVCSGAGPMSSSTSTTCSSRIRAGRSWTRVNRPPMPRKSARTNYLIRVTHSSGDARGQVHQGHRFPRQPTTAVIVRNHG